MQKISLQYHTRGGNTEILANTIKQALQDSFTIVEDCESEIIVIGFWTDKGIADEQSLAVLEKLHNKQIFLFGSAGFGGTQQYFDQILQRTINRISDDNEVIGTFMCQGRMPISVRNRYVSLLNENPKMEAMIANFDKALEHPNEKDQYELVVAIKKALAI